MNIVNPKLEQLKGLGLELNDNGVNYLAHTCDAQDYASENFVGQGYTLGCVMASTESLTLAEYDVCFQQVEDHAHKLSKEDYTKLHELAELNDGYGFVEKLKAMGDEDSVYHELADEIHDHMVEIENELDQIILALGGTIQKEEN